MQSIRSGKNEEVFGLERYRWTGRWLHSGPGRLELKKVAGSNQKLLFMCFEVKDVGWAGIRYVVIVFSSIFVIVIPV